MAQIEFKNLETLEYFKPLINEIEQTTRTYQNKCKRILILQKSGLCSQPIEEDF